jgi:hypothetical protein
MSREGSGVRAQSAQDETQTGLICASGIRLTMAKAARSRARMSIQEVFSCFDPVGIYSLLYPVCFPRKFIVLFGSEMARCKKLISRC